MKSLQSYTYTNIIKKICWKCIYLFTHKHTYKEYSKWYKQKQYNKNNYKIINL